MSGYGGEKQRRDLHRVHCDGCPDDAHRDTGPVGLEAARLIMGRALPDHPSRAEDRLMRRYFGDGPAT